MMQIVLLLVIACTLLLVVGFLVRDTFSKRRRRLNELKTTDPPAALEADIAPRPLMDRIFAEDDHRFAASEGKAVLRVFLTERRRVAFSWLRQTKGEATRILRLHLRAVRSDFALRHAVEIQLILHTLLFFAVYALLWFLVACYGAHSARSLIRNVVTLAGSLSGLGGRILADAGRSGMIAQSHGHA